MARKRAQGAPLARVGLPVGAIALVIVVVMVVDFRPNKSHLDLQLLAGPAEGNYVALATGMADAAKRDGGAVAPVVSRGSVDNIEQLAAAADGCKIQFALAQDGIPVPRDAGLEMVARLPKSESLVLLGKDASRFKRFADLKGARIGAGELKSGTDQLVREIFGGAFLSQLELKLDNHPLAEQLDLAAAGELDLAAVVIDEDAALVRTALVDRGLELAPLQNLDVIARRYPHVWHGRIGAGQYDAVTLLPAVDVRVLRVDTLVLGNGCASHAETVAFLSILRDSIPGLIDHNRKRGPGELTLSATSKDFFANGGPELVDVHLPWLVDILPPSQWIYIITAVSILFNIMGFGHRFQLWRLDANRERIDGEVREALGATLTDEEIHNLEPLERHLRPELHDRLEVILDDLATLLARCRRQSVSMLVPMGQEMAYRYQEDAIDETITALRLFAARLEQRLDEAV